MGRVETTTGVYVDALKISAAEVSECIDDFFLGHGQLLDVPYEYPTLVRALGIDGFELVASLRPTSPKAAESRLLALSVFTGAEAMAAMCESVVPNKRAQKLIDAYRARNT